MKIPAVRLSFRAGLATIPTHGVASQIYGLTTVLLHSWMQEDTHGKFEILMLSILQTSQVLTFVHNRISPHYSLFDMTNDYPFEMRICTCVVKPFGSLQVVIRLGEWQAAGSRIGQVQTSESRCQNCPFEMINACLFEMIYDSHFESRAVSIGRQSARNGSETRSESRD